MKYISTTELRTKSSQLVEDLRNGISVALIHRSEVVGTIAPAETSKEPGQGALERLMRLAGNRKATTSKEREQAYATHMEGRYGHDIP